jgi:hypothetical protein
MKFYKDKNNAVHNIDEKHKHLLPGGCSEITQSEMELLIKPTDEQKLIAEDEVLIQAEIFNTAARTLRDEGKLKSKKYK